jgi:predicted transcriptional regulator
MNEFVEAIDMALKVHPLSEKILQFLAEHEGVMDTIHGVARCWVDSDEVAVQPILEQLVSAGLIVKYTLSSGTYYSLTSDQNVREHLKANHAGRLCRRQVVTGPSDGSMRNS